MFPYLERKTGLEPANLRLGKPTLCQLSYFRIKQFFRVTYLAYTCGPDFSGWIFPSPVTYLQVQIASPIAFVIRFELTPPASCRCAAATPNKIFRSIVPNHTNPARGSFQYCPTPPNNIVQMLSDIRAGSRNRTGILRLEISCTNRCAIPAWSGTRAYTNFLQPYFTTVLLVHFRTIIIKLVLLLVSKPNRRCTWSACLDLNQGPPPYQGGALTN